jgi:dolichyl-phosphate-mannose--protein O-mannosyl transferase
MFFVLSRVAMNDIYATAGIVTAAYLLLRFWTEPERRARFLVTSGVVLGLAVSMKWTAAPALAGAVVLSLARILRDRRPGVALRRDLAAWAIGLLVLPPLVYLLSYTPYFLSGHSWTEFVTLNREIAYFHEHLAATHSQASRWYQWPLDFKPVWLSSRVSGETRRELYAMGSPLVWWLFLPAIAWSAQRFVRKRQPGDALVVIGFCAAWLPWVFVPRVTFMQYLLPGVPFGVLGIVTMVNDLETALRRRPILGIYTAACAATFVYFYPIWSALPISQEAYASHRWLWFTAWR